MKGSSGDAGVGMRGIVLGFIGWKWILVGIIAFGVIVLLLFIYNEGSFRHFTPLGWYLGGHFTGF